MLKTIVAAVAACTIAAGFVATRTETVVVANRTASPTVNTNPVAKAPVTVNNTETSLVTQTVTVSPSQVIYFDTPVMPETVDAAISLLNSNTNSTVYLVINSPGGSVLDGGRLINAIQRSPKNIITVCDNICASMGFQIFEVGKKRLMTPHSLLMAHPASGGAMGTLENMAAQINAFVKYVDRLDAEVAKRSGIDYDKFKHMVADNIWAETPEAISLGLADGVTYLEVHATYNDKTTASVLQYVQKNNQQNPNTNDLSGYDFGVVNK